MLRLKATAALVAATAFSVAAVEGWDLTSSDVRQAYFLGQRRGDQRLFEFLTSYEHRLSAPPTGPHVLSIVFSTPYHQIVERSRRALPGYSSQQAERNYHANPERIYVSATVSFPIGHVARPREPRIWNEFDMRLVQSERLIRPHQLSPELVYSFGEDGSLVGFILRAEFSTHQVGRGLARVEVITHDGKTVSVQFDLVRLK